MKTVTIHDQAYEMYSWQVAGDDVLTLATKIIESGQKYDRIIALAKGGLTFGRALGDYLQVKELSSIQIKLYNDVNSTNDEALITQGLPVSIENERILIIDDIVDTGETLKVALEYLKYHGAKSITSAALLTKPWSTVKPDFTVRETEAWVIFAHEVRESIELLSNNWQKKGDSPEEITKNLAKIGISKPEVAMFGPVK